jgi:hypothetical protein
VLRELGHGNGGTVSKVQHAATKVIMARKVSTRRLRHLWGRKLTRAGHTCRSEERSTETNRARTSNHARLQLRLHCRLLWRLPKFFWRCDNVHGVHGRGVGASWFVA